MNEQIADILNQPAFERLKDWHVIGPVQKATLELFAQLIVRECASVCESMQLIGPYKEVQDATLKDASQKLKEHFGVTE